MRLLSGKNDLTEGVVWRKLLRFFFPILLGLLFQQLYNTADALILGRFVNDDALGAVGGSCAAITNVIIGFFNGLNGGATVLISQKYGAGDHDGVSKTLHTAIIFCLGIGLLITVCGYFATPALLKMVGNPATFEADSTTYLRIYLVGAIPLLMYNLFQGTLQGVGDSGRPLIYLICSCVTNICLDLLFVGALKMEVAGAAWASVISMTLCVLLAASYLFRVQGPHRVQIKKLRFDKSMFRGILRIGLPAGIQGSMYSISNLIIQSAVNTFDHTMVTSWTATGKLDGFYWSVSNAFGVAICAFVGQCYGAGKIDRMKKAIRICMIIALITTVILSATLMLVAYPAYHTFIRDEQTILDAIEIMSYFVPYYFVWSFVEVLGGTFRGTGDTLRPMIMTMLGTCVLRIIWMAFVVPHWHTIMAVSIIYVISWCLTGTAFIVYYFKGNWMRLKREPKPSIPS